MRVRGSSSNGFVALHSAVNGTSEHGYGRNRVQYADTPSFTGWVSPGPSCTA